jgi:N-acetylmuramoyl-L-alanine amidase
MKRVAFCFFLILMVLSAGCTPGMRDDLATLAAQAGQTAVAGGKDFAATQAQMLEETASARVSTEVAKKLKSRWLIGIDPGHGWGGESGASAGGYLEKDINLAVAVKVRGILEEEGYRVVMTRESDEVNYGLERAAQVVNEAKVDLVVSIHSNAGGGTGTEACYTYGKSTDGKSLDLAVRLTQEVSNQLGLTNRGIFLENDLARCARGGSQLYIHDMNAPAALIEMAFLDTDSDRELMVNQQDAFARAIADAVMGYLGK